MRAAVLHEIARPFQVEDVDVAGPGPGEVTVQMQFAGVCLTDLHIARGVLASPLPVIPGHEGAGVVVDVGEGVTSLAAGDHVVPLWRTSCGVCRVCSKGRPALCDSAWRIRSSGCLADGTTRFRRRCDGSIIYHWAGVSTFAGVSTMPEGAALKIRSDVPLELAALVSCAVITGVGAVVNAARVIPGATVAVFGAGGVGLNAIQGARLAGALDIFAVDLHDQKLELARKFGATHVINARHQSAVAAILDRTGGQGVDAAFEVVGLPSTIADALTVTRKGGECIVVGVAGPEVRVPISPSELVLQEKTLKGSIYGSSQPRVDIPMLLELYLAGKLMLDELLTRTYPLEQINEAYRDLEQGRVARCLVRHDHG